MSSESQTAAKSRTARGDRLGGGPASPFVDPAESLHSLQDVLGRKWQPIIVYHLLDGGALRFSGLKDRIDGISSKMLSESLDTLENTGVVDRTLISDQPVQVEYSLTDRGRALEPVVRSMVQWGTEHGTQAGGTQE